MTTSPTSQARASGKQGVNLGANAARITDTTKFNPKEQLPPDMQSDLQDSFEYFARGNQLISRSDFESIIHNFGYNRISQRDKENELLKMDNEYYRRTGFDYEFMEKVVNMRWNKGGGANNVCLEAFKVFDRYERLQIKPSDLKQTFAEYLDHPVND